jgi:hypothetical protein
MPETFNKPEWRKAGGMNAKRRDVPRTSTGRRVEIIAYREPLKGELYLKPSGVRGVFLVLRAENDHAKHYRMILRE